MDDAGQDIQSQVVEWLRANGWRYRAASRQFGIPYATVQTWGKAAKAGAPLPSPDKRTDSRARARAEAPPQPVDEEWDPTECTREEFLIRAIKRCLSAAKRDEATHSAVARQWETSAGNYRTELDDLRDQERRKNDARGRSEQVDAEDLARRLCRKAGILARLAPDEARRLCHALAVALGEREAG